MAYKLNPFTGNLDYYVALPLGNLSDPGTDGITVTGGAGAVVGSGTSISQRAADATHNGYLSAADWAIFNNKLSPSFGNYITNPDAEIDTSGWNLYNNSGNTATAYVVISDITFTSVAPGTSGNGINIDYVFHPTQSYTNPLVTVLSPTHVTVAWYNGPTVLNNPTATQLKAAWDAVPGAVALATSAITGTASRLQYITGGHLTANGGDTTPINGVGGSIAGVTFTRNTSTPLVGTASFDLGKDANNRQGQGVSTDFVINSLDVGQTLQISFAYKASAGMVLGSNADVQIFAYDISNAVLIPVTPLRTLSGSVNTAKTFVGKFQTVSSSSSYRLILHITTTNAAAWDLSLDQVVVNDVITPGAATQVPSVVLLANPVSGAVTDRMVVMWTDGATQWVPATISGASGSISGDLGVMLGFATNIIGSVADIYIRGYMNGFSFGPFVGFEQYIDNTAGQISPLPSPFNDAYVGVGKSISSTELNIDFYKHIDAVGVKGGLLTNNGANNGGGDTVLIVGANGNVLVANSAVANGINWAAAVVAANPFTYTVATRTLTFQSQAANTFLAAPNGLAGAPTARLIVAADIPTLNQNTTGSAATLTTPRTIAGSSFNGSANIALANKFIVQGTADAGLTAAQFLGSLATGILKNTTTTGVLSIATGSDIPTVMTILGDLVYGGAAGAPTRLAGDTSNIRKFLRQLSVGGVSTAPVWDVLSSTDISNLSSVPGATVTNALNTINQSVQEVLLSAINNGTTVTANTTIPTWATVSADTLSGFAASTGIYTIQVAGDYVVDFSAATTTGTPLSQVYKNGVLVQTGTGSGVRSTSSTTIPGCVVGDTITVALNTSLTLTSTNTDTILNISKISGSASQVVNARYHSCATAITSVLATVTYTVKDFDTQSAAYSGGVYTIPSAGKYMVKASLSLTAATAAAGNNYDIIIRKNGTEVARYKYVVGAATQKPNTVVVEDLVSCVLNDTIDIQASAAGTTPSISNGTTSLNFFYINKMSN